MHDVGVRSPATFAVPVTSTFAAGRRTSGARLIISTVHPPLRAVSGHGATIFAALAATFFRVPAFIFIGRSSHPAFIMERAVKHTLLRPLSLSLSAFNPLLFFPSTHSRPHDGSNYPFEYVLFERSVEKLFWSTWSRNGRRRLTQAIMKTILYILLLIIFFL